MTYINFPDEDHRMSGTAEPMYLDVFEDDSWRHQPEDNSAVEAQREAEYEAMYESLQEDILNELHDQNDEPWLYQDCLDAEF